MAHEFESGFFVREAAWHGLGTVVQSAPTVGDALRLAGLDWKVLQEPVYLEGGVEIEGKLACVRSTDRKVLGVLGDTYRPLQNDEAFAFFNPFVADGDATLETAGSLRGGQRVWILAKIAGEEREVVNGDKVAGYLLLSNSHDGTLAVRIQFTAIRVVCMNTLGAAISLGDRGKEENVRFIHRSGLDEALKITQNAVELGRRTFAFSVSAYRAMAATGLPADGLRKYVREVFEVPEAEDKMPRAWEQIEALADSGAGTELGGVKGTVWGAYNAVTEWVDHKRGQRADGKDGRSTPESRLESSWFGVGKDLRQRAFDAAVALADWH